MSESCPNCGYAGKRDANEKTKNYSLFGITLLSRKYGTLKCPECDYEESIDTLYSE